MHVFLTYWKLLSPIRFLLFLALLGSVSCQKEKSVESGLPSGSSSGSAVFALIPSGSNCSDAVVSGTFTAGTDPGIDAKITVTVNVTKAGDWLYSTAVVNGFAFVGSGIFTAAGSQAITLQAVGKPIAAGNSDFGLSIGGATCKVAVTVDASGGGGGTTTSTFYYKATIAGVSYTQGESNDFEAGSGMGGTDEVVFGGGINYINPPLPAGLTEFGIDKGMMRSYLSATQALFKAYFAPGDYPYAPVSYSQGDGVRIYWTDKKGENWDTRDGTVDQTGSTFKIISTEGLVDLTGTYYVKVKSQFSCKLYNATTGAMVQLTNGEAVLAFGML